MHKRSSRNKGKPNKANISEVVESPKKNPHAVALGSRGGRVGGKVRAERLTPSRRSEIASRAAFARWQGAVQADERMRPQPTKGSEETRQLILKAAHKEFTKHGLAGSRVDRIAASAGVNKRMLYHHFKNKEELFREMLRRNLTELSAEDAATPQDMGEALVYWQKLIVSNPDWMRLSLWEALSYGGEHMIGEEERRTFWGGAVEQIEREQAAGNVRAEMDAALLQLCLVAAVAFPIALPQMTRLITGFAPEDPEFLRRQNAFLLRLGKLLG
jgi:AcrR family transcriptional regulator